MKADNIEQYTIGTLFKLRETYDQFMEKSGGYDPDFPMTGLSAAGTDNKNKNGKQNIKIKGKNVYSGFDEDNPDPNFNGIEQSAVSKAMSSGKIKNID